MLRLKGIVLGLAGFAALLIQGAAAETMPLDPMADAIRTTVEALQEGSVPARPAVGISLEQAALRFYGHRNFAPAWDKPALLDQLVAGLAGMADDGLDPEDYALSRIAAGRALLLDARANPTQRAAVEVLATRAYIRALFHLTRGKLDPDGLAPRAFDPETGLARIYDGLDHGEITATFAAARPRNPLYDKLRAGLRALRAVAAAGGWPELGAGPTLKPGMTDPRVIALRQRLAMSGYLAADAVTADATYDTAVEAAVTQFQNDYYLDPDGFVGAATRAAMNIPVAARIDQIRVNLERARELMDIAVGDFVLVDIAGYRVSYFRDGKAIWRSRVVVGKPYRQTPEFKSEITYITLNPTWTVPPTILRNDILPKVRRNPGYLAANHLRVFDAAGREISPAHVDWRNPRGLTLRQDAGPWNALGEVAIRFPNPYAVYLHDTPHQELFGKAQRDFSSGCIRTERPFELVYLLFNANDAAARAVIDDAVASGKTQTRTLPKPVPLLLIYWTVSVQNDGRITFKPDIYHRDPQVLAALNARVAL